ncbi:hypothetical protein PFFVO_02028 [Plasmodium falciparum Vietnam Oak-Knoll (FVO)]|uniref:Uncharacterized protein n=1 Tax=Plasmodium falciparum Vietnam Oak-Knoll (FVO) TaxID=1036723 RepID=A0A024V950_PLAFA|nr:hypothetical protein PFFVO_02028 [Plasmodium falciparum Vietnam Oak-Knoll (FVO)]
MFYKYIINIHYDLIYIFLKILSPSTYVEYYYKASIYMSSTLFNFINILYNHIYVNYYFMFWCVQKLLYIIYKKKTLVKYRK